MVAVFILFHSPKKKKKRLSIKQAFSPQILLNELDNFFFNHQATQNISRYNQQGIKQQIKQYSGNLQHYFYIFDRSDKSLKVEKAIGIKTILEK